MSHPLLFETLELFEQILLLLDTRTLLLSQRTSRWFHKVISSSKPLQRKLFFLPTTTFSELLSLGLLDISDTEVFNILDATSNRCKWLQQVVVLNDVLFDTSREWRLRSVAYASPKDSSMDVGGVVPSWRRMLLTQPPPSTGHGDVMFWFEDGRDNDELCQDVDTMGAMMDSIYAKGARSRGFKVQWETAAVRPVKHAVDGAYYGRLLRQRRREKRAEEELEVGGFGRKGNVDGGRESGGFDDLGVRAERVANSMDGEGKM